MGRCCRQPMQKHCCYFIHSYITKYRIAIWRDAVIRRWEPDMRRDGNCEDIRLGDMRCGGNTVVRQQSVHSPVTQTLRHSLDTDFTSHWVLSCLLNPEWGKTKTASLAYE